MASHYFGICARLLSYDLCEPCKSDTTPSVRCEAAIQTALAWYLLLLYYSYFTRIQCVRNVTVRLYRIQPY